MIWFLTQKRLTFTIQERLMIWYINRNVDQMYWPSLVNGLRARSRVFENHPKKSHSTASTYDQKHHYYLQDLSNFGAKIQIGTWWKYWDIFKDFKTVWHINLDTIIRKYWTKNIVYICPLGTLFLFVDIPICVVTNAKAMKWNKALKRLFYCFVHWKKGHKERAPHRKWHLSSIKSCTLNEVTRRGQSNRDW